MVEVVMVVSKNRNVKLQPVHWIRTIPTDAVVRALTITMISLATLSYTFCVTTRILFTPAALRLTLTCLNGLTWSNRDPTLCKQLVVALPDRPTDDVV